MRVLIDTHVVLSLLNGSLEKQYSKIAGRLTDPWTTGYVSVATLWEIAIKTRLGKLDLGMPLEDIVGFVGALGLAILRIEAAHVVSLAYPEPATRDPFDRLLLAQCGVEGLLLATADRALAAHPLALKV